MTKRSKLAVGGAILASAIALGYGLGKARASGGPTTAPLWYSGQLTDSNGAALPDASHTFAFKLYRAGTTTTLCDTTGAPAGIMTSRGYFRVQLDACVATTVHAEPDTTLEVFIDGASMGAAQKVGASPYALEATNAATAASAADGGALAADIDALKAKRPIVTYDGGTYSLDAKYCGSFGDPLSNDGRGYAGMKAACQAVTGCSASAHMCTSDEVIRSLSLGMTLPDGAYLSAAWAAVVSNTQPVDDYDGLGAYPATAHFGPYLKAGVPTFNSGTSTTTVLCCD